MKQSKQSIHDVINAESYKGKTSSPIIQYIEKYCYNCKDFGVEEDCMSIFKTHNVSKALYRCINIRQFLDNQKK